MKKSPLHFWILALLAALLGSTPGARAQAQWELWAPNRAPQIVTSFDASPNDKDAAAELQKYLQKISGLKIPVRDESQAAPGPNLIYVGRTSAAAKAGVLPARRGAGDESYVIAARAKTKNVFLIGANDAGTKYAVYDFLARFGGVRWYLPGDLFEHVPGKPRLRLSETTIIEKPAFAARTFGYIGKPFISSGDERDPQFNQARWVARNRLSLDGRVLPHNHSHNLYNVIVASRAFEAHPEWFPLIGGQRFKPPTDDYQNWQPELTNPQVVEKFIEAGREFFKNNPDPQRWFSLGINDGEGWSNSPEAIAARGEARYFRKRLVQSEMYYAFVSKVANALLKEFPDRKIGVIAYFAVEEAPRTIGQLPPNVNVVITQETSNHHDANYLQQDIAMVKSWQAVANGNVYRYDYQGMGWLLPRYFPELVVNDARTMQALGLKGYYTEDVPTWATMGPLLFITAQAWWNPQVSADELQNQYCKDLFGPAAAPMREYLKTLSKVWMTPRPGVFFEGIGNIPAQAKLYDDATLDKLDALLQRAADDAKKAKTNRAVYEKRVAFIRDGWKLGAYYAREYNLMQKAPSPSSEKRIEDALRLTELLDEHAAFYQEYKTRGELQARTTVWVLDELQRDSNWFATVPQAFLAALLAHSGGDRAVLKKAIARYEPQVRGKRARDTLELLKVWSDAPPSPNLLKNPDLQPADGAGSTPGLKAGLPPGWDFWRNSTGETSFGAADDKNVLHLSGADSAAFLQKHPVQPGDIAYFTARVRSSAKFGGKLLFRVRWQNEKGDWFPDGGGGLDLIANSSITSQWQTVSLLGRVPQGAAHAVVLMGSENTGATEWIEFSAPRLEIVRGKAK
jgi:hypothetical protein